MSEELSARAGGVLAAAALEAAARMASFSLSVAALKWSPRVIHQPVAPNRGSCTVPTGST